MVDFGKYAEFISGKVKLDLPAHPDEDKTAVPDGVITVNLEMTQKEAEQLTAYKNPGGTLYQILKKSYPDWDEKVLELFLMRYGTTLFKQFLKWSGVTDKDLEEQQKLQMQLMESFVKASPEERKNFMQSVKEMSKE